MVKQSNQLEKMYTNESLLRKLKRLNGTGQRTTQMNHAKFFQANLFRRDMTS